MNKDFHAIYPDKSKCLGCTNCLKTCPTGAIRICDGKASIDYQKCISCGSCIKSCPSHAIIALSDDITILNKYKYNVAIMSSCLYAQFPHLFTPELILNALHNIGFNYVYEEARACDLLSMLKREMFVCEDVKGPVISTVCPACVQLILSKYQSLEDNLIDHLAPLCLAGKEARCKARELSGLSDKDIGVFYISPCPANVQAIKNGFYSGFHEINGAISVSEIFKKLTLVDAKDVEISQEVVASSQGVSWATSGGEAASFPNTKQLAADGIFNVISILRELEDGNLRDINFVELLACHSGCVGGVMNVINTFVAKSKIHTLRRTAFLNKTNHTDTLDKDLDYYKIPFKWETNDVYKLDKNFIIAMQKMKQVEEVLSTLPMLDCGLCGSPTCRDFAEDVVLGKFDRKKCIIHKDDK